jgi:hypothetical protein
MHQIRWRVTGLPIALDAFNAIPRRRETPDIIISVSSAKLCLLNRFPATLLEDTDLVVSSSEVVIRGNKESLVAIRSFFGIK